MYNSGFNNGGQQQQPLFSQQTGYQQQPMYQQQTGYQPQQQQQPLGAQATGYQPQYGANQFQQQQQPLYGQPTGYAAPQQLLQTQPTGYSQTLQSQATGYYTQQQQQQQPQQQPQQQVQSTPLKIPNIRLSFLTASTQQKYEQLFRTSVPSNSQTIPASNARDILLRSGLSAQQLAIIWELSDLNKSGELLFPEFCLALYLVESALQGRELKVVNSVKGEVEGFVDAINFSVGDTQEDSNSKRKTPFDELIGSGVSFGQPQTQMPQGISFGGAGGGLQPQMTGYTALQPQRTGFSQPLMPQSTGYLPQSSFSMPLQPQTTGFNQQQQQQPPSTSFGSAAMLPLQQQTTGFQPLLPQQTGYQPNYQPPALLQAQKTGVGNNSMFQSNLLRPQATGFQNMNSYASNSSGQEFIHDGERQKFYNIFSQYDSKKSGKLDAQTCAEIFRKSGLNRSELEKVWNLINEGNKPYLTREQFALGMWLIYKKLNGNELPLRLPDSLKPNSAVILEGVKNDLKGFGNVNGGANHSSFGSSFNKQKEEEKEEKEEAKEIQPKNIDELTFLKQQLSESQTKLKALQFEINQDRETESRETEANLKAIESLKTQIKSLPAPPPSQHQATELKTKLSNLTTTELPQLIQSILSTESSLSEAKIQLYRAQHPSSLVGSGPNGQVTEQDIRKAKSKALLNQRMFALTGRPSADSVDYEKEQEEYNRYVEQVKSQERKDQEIVWDVERGIKEIMKGIKLNTGGASTQGEINKWVYGVGVSEEVGEFIKELRMNTQPTAAAVAPGSNNSAIGSAYSSARSSPVPSQAQAPRQTYSAPPSVSQSSTPEPVATVDRATYLKEQAQKRMKERLAKFGIKREFGSNRTQTVETVGASPQPSVASTPISTPTPLQAQAPLQVQQQEVKKTVPEVVKAPKPTPPPKPISRNASTIKPAPALVQSDDDDDEEEKALRAQLEALKLKKQREKEERLKKLREELEAEERDEQAQEAKAVKTYAPTPPAAAKEDQQPRVELKSQESNNPFGKPPSPSQSQSQSQPQQPAVSSNNPFGKPPQAQAQQYFQPTSSQSTAPPHPPTLDPSLIAQQRKAQRGEVDSDTDSWGDSDSEKNEDQEEEEELVNRQGAAKLAGLLFGSAGGSRGNSSSSIPQVASTTPAASAVAAVAAQAKPVPIAAPLPVINNSNNRLTEAVPTVIAPVQQQQQEEEIPVNTAPPAVPIAPPLPTFSAPAVVPAVPETIAPETPADLAQQEEEPREEVEEFYTPPPVPITVPAAVEAPAIPSVPTPPIPQFEAPPSAPEAPSSIPPSPPPPAMMAPPLPSFSVPEIPQPQQQTPPPPPPPPAALPMPSTSAPPPPPLPSFAAPPAPPAPSGIPPPPPPPPTPPAPAASTPAPPIGGGLPFLADIQKRRDDTHVVG